MNDDILKLALDAGLLNYIDNETPRHYFLSANADEKDLEEFAELIIEKCCSIADEVEDAEMDSRVSKYIRAYFGVK